MTLKALGEYDFPSRDRRELFGDDLLVNVLWDGNPFFCSAACLRVPGAMRWADFRAQMIDPLFAGDPDYQPAKASNWRLDETPLTPSDNASLTDLGIPHKGLIRFQA